MDLNLISRMLKFIFKKRELDFAFESRGNPSFDFEILEALIQQPNVIWLRDDQGKITNEIYYEVVGGHTHFMQIFKITENNETVFLWSRQPSARVLSEISLSLQKRF